MPLQAQQIVALSCQIAKCPGFTAQGGQFLNATLQDFCQDYDLDAALGNFQFSFNSATGQGSGPYTLPADYLRTQVKDGKDEFFYTINGVPYPLIQCTKAEYDWMVQTAGFQNFPYYYATDLSTTPAQLFVWPPASGAYPCTLRYYKLMPDIATPESSTTIPWFLNTNILIRATAGRLMGITGDEREQEFMGLDPEKSPNSVSAMMSAYLKNVEDREGAVHTVGRDRRRWGRSFDLLKNTKTIGWVLLAALMWLASPNDAQANCTTPCTKAQITSDINTNWPDNTSQAITPALLRSTVLDLVNSYLDINAASSFTCTTHQFLTAIASLSSYTCAQPLVTDISGLGTGVATALQINVGTSGAFVALNGALGTPSSGTLTNATGLPISTGLTGAGTGVLTALAVNTNSAGGFPTYTASTWTPVFVGTTIAGSCTYVTQIGVYEQIGRHVTARFQISTSACGTTPTGNITVSGLPVAQNSGNNGQCFFGFVGGWTGGAGYTFLSGAVLPSASVISIFDQGSSKTALATPVTEVNLTSNNIQGFCDYNT